MFVLSVKRRLAVIAMPVLGLVLAMGVVHAQPSGPASAAGQPAQAPQPTERFVDGIAAVVNKQVITLFQVEQELKAAQKQLAMQDIQAPDDDTLRRQVLQRMITEELIKQQARRLNVSVSDAQLNEAIANISRRNNMSEAQLKAEIEKSGVAWDYYRRSLRQEILTDLVRQREVDNRIMISDNEVDAFLRSQSVTGGFVGGAQGAPAGQQSAAQGSPMQPLGLAQILIQVPESASPAQVQEYRREAQDALARINAGEDFAAVAAAVSDGQGALEGGDMGVRPAQGWPDLFLQAVQNLSENEVSDIIQSGNGFHILKVTTRGQPSGGAQPPQSAQPQPPAANQQQNEMAAVFQSDGPMMVTQTRVRHILIKTDQATSEERARTRLEDIRQRVLAGEDFSDLARRYSEDASAPLGGELGWLSPGETVPPFEQAMDNLEPGEISEPVRTQFGWHLITVEERRTEDMEDEFKRMRAREVLFERQVGPAFEDWLGQIRAQAYIDNRLDPRGNQLNRN
ncbi:MAG TPA: molecular chaperone SurA [Pusillimonas sp.]|nr:molecular chaperone SurA [Pusillimonas sp.]